MVFVFFSRKSYNLFTLKINFLWFDFCKFSAFSLLKGKKLHYRTRKKCEDHEKRDRLLVSKVDLF